MTEALHKSAEALAFIKEGQPKPAKERQKNEPNAVDSFEGGGNEDKSVKDDSSKSHQSSNDKQQKVEGGGEEDLLVPVTFRLPENIADNLLRASLTRKLGKKEPHTKQDIAAEALKEWLEKEGYLK